MKAPEREARALREAAGAVSGLLSGLGSTLTVAQGFLDASSEGGDHRRMALALGGLSDGSGAGETLGLEVQSTRHELAGLHKAAYRPFVEFIPENDIGTAHHAHVFTWANT